MLSKTTPDIFVKFLSLVTNTLSVLERKDLVNPKTYIASIKLVLPLPFLPYITLILGENDKVK